MCAALLSQCSNRATSTPYSASCIFRDRWMIWSEWCMKGGSNETTSLSDQVCNGDHNHHPISSISRQHLSSKKQACSCMQSMLSNRHLLAALPSAAHRPVQHRKSACCWSCFWTRSSHSHKWLATQPASHSTVNVKQSIVVLWVQ